MLNKKVIIFSHGSDIDGVNCVVLAKLAFNQIDYVLAPNIEKLEIIFREYIESNKLIQYDNIYVTDLALYEPALSMVNDSCLKDKVLIYDHHKRAIDDHMNKYLFTKIVEEVSGKKTCGTQLFYNYLVENNLLNVTPAIEEFVELTRLEDTWEWKKAESFGIKAHDLAILFNSIELEKYILSVLTKLKNNTNNFLFDEEEKDLIQAKKDNYQKKLQSIMSTAEYFTDELGNKYGIAFADYEYRNELAEWVKNNKTSEKIKYFIVVAMDKGEFGQKSYRAIEENFDVNEIAKLHGGGGHIAAAAVNITEQQKNKSLTLSKKEGLKYLAESKYS